MKNKSLFAGIAIAALALVVSFGSNVYANPSYFVQTTQTAAATTTLSYLTAGSGTATVIYDSYNNGNPYKTDSAVLFTQFSASTTPTFAISLQYSQDNVDYYADTLDSHSTTTASVSLNTPNSFIFSPAASSTLRAIKIDTPTRYTKVIYSVSGSNGAVWGQIVPNKERPE